MFKPCPVCGRAPRMEHITANMVAVECKLPFKAPHLSIVVGYSHQSKLTEIAEKCWNQHVNSWHEPCNPRYDGKNPEVVMFDESYFHNDTEDIQELQPVNNLHKTKDNESEETKQ